MTAVISLLSLCSVIWLYPEKKFMSDMILHLANLSENLSAVGAVLASWRLTLFMCWALLIKRRLLSFFATKC
jgi:hypothetical protein